MLLYLFSTDKEEFDEVEEQEVKENKIKKHNNNLFFIF